VVEDEVADRSQRCRGVVEDLAEQPGLLHLAGRVRLARVLVGLERAPDGFATPAPVDDDAFVADLGETAVRYLLAGPPV
jgi:hypothetical protein